MLFFLTELAHSPFLINSASGEDGERPNVLVHLQSLLLLRFCWRLPPRPAAEKTVTPESTHSLAIMNLIAEGDVKIQKWGGRVGGNHPVTLIKTVSLLKPLTCSRLQFLFGETQEILPRGASPTFPAALARTPTSPGSLPTL